MGGAIVASSGREESGWRTLAAGNRPAGAAPVGPTDDYSSTWSAGAGVSFRPKSCAALANTYTRVVRCGARSWLFGVRLGRGLSLDVSEIYVRLCSKKKKK